MTTQEGYHQVWEALTADTNITDVCPGGEPCRLAAVLEAPSQTMEDELSRLLAWEGVLSVDIALLSYEDEVAAGGQIQCPPHKPRKRAVPRA